MAINTDITTKGSLNYRELQQGNAEATLDEMTKAALESYANSRQQKSINPLESYAFSGFDPNHTGTEQVRSSLYNLETGEYWGRKSYDSKELDANNFNNHLANDRANNQGQIRQISNGIGKGAVIAGTTFLDATIGGFYGLGNAIFNLEGNENSDFWSRMWDNSFNDAMAQVNKDIEDILPNYYTEAQQAGPWYSWDNIWSANFLGDKLIKNMGFTAGTIAAMAIPGSNPAGAIAQGLSKLGRGFAMVNKALNAGKISRQALGIASNINKVGNVAAKIVTGLGSSLAEASVEAINASKDNIELIENNINAFTQQASSEALRQYELTGDLDAYNNALKEIEQTATFAKDEAARKAVELGNRVFLGNVAILSLSNALEFGHTLFGGFNNQKGTKELFKHTIQDKVGVNFAAETKRVTGKDILGAMAKNFISEGAEEGSQNLISDSNQMRHQAQVNVATKKFITDNDMINNASLLKMSINPDVDDNLIDYTKALSNSWKENFGSFDKGGWEEVILGGISGMIGAPGVHRNGRGKTSWWAGGIAEVIQANKDENYQNEQLAAQLNKAFNTKEFSDNTRRAIAALTIDGTMNGALDQNKITMFKNSELMGLASQAIHAKNLGQLDAILEYYENVANNPTTEDIAAYRALLKKQGISESFLDGKTDEQLKQEIKDKNKSTLEKIKSVLDLYESHSQSLNPKLEKLEGTFEEKEWTIRELTAKAALIADLKRRKAEVESKLNDPNISDIDKATQNKNLEEINSSLENNQKNYDELYKNPEKALQNTQEIFKQAEKIRVGKKAKSAAERFKGATTFEDMVDAYLFTDDSVKEEAFNIAYNEATDEQKKVLDQLLPVLSAVKNKDSYIEDAVNKAKDSYVNKAIVDLYQGLIDQAVQNGDEESAYKFQSALNEYTKQEDTIKNSANNIINAVINRALESISNAEVKDVANSKSYLIDQIKKEGQNIVNEIEDENSKKFVSDLVASLVDSMTNDTNTYQEHLNYVKKQQEEKKKVETKKPQVEVKTEKDGSTSTNNAPTNGRSKPKFEVGLEGKEVKPTPQGKPKPKFEVLNLGGEEQTSEEKPLPNEKTMTPEQVDNIEEIQNTPTPERSKIVTPEVETPEVAEQKQTERQLSLSGHSYSEYNNADLEEGVLTEKKRHDSSSLEKFLGFLDDKGFNITRIVENYLPQVLAEKKDGKIDVHYVLAKEGKRGNTTGEIANGIGTENYEARPYVLLATPISDKLASTISKDPKVAGNIIEQNGKKFLVVGNLAYMKTAEESNATSESERREAEAKNTQRTNYTTAVNNLVNEAGNFEGEFFISNENGEANNYIYDITSGYVIRKTSKEESATDININELLNDENANPDGLKATDLTFLVIKGEASSSQYHIIGADKNAKVRFPKDFNKAGKVYLLLKGADGTYIPQALTTLNFNDLSQEQLNNIGINRLLTNIINAKTPEEIHKAMGALRQKFIFNSRRGGNGTNIFYNEESGDITVSKGGVVHRGMKLIINSPMSMEDKMALLKDMIRYANPRVRVNVSNLERRPDEYLKQGILRGNLRSLHIYGGSTYLHPLNAEGKPIIDNVVNRESSSKQSKITTTHRWLNGVEYTIGVSELGTTYTNKEGKPVSPEIESQLKDILLITSNKLNPTEVGKQEYYVVSPDRVYKKIRGGHYILATDEYKKNVKKETQKQEKKKAIENVENKSKEDKKQNSKKKSSNKKENSSVSSSVETKENVTFTKLIKDNWASYKNSIIEIIDNEELTKIETIKEFNKRAQEGHLSEMYNSISDEQSLKEYLAKVEECGF